MSEIPETERTKRAANEVYAVAWDSFLRSSPIPGGSFQDWLDWLGLKLKSDERKE